MKTTQRAVNVRSTSDWWHAKEVESAAAITHGNPSKVDSDNARFLARIAYRRLGTWDAVAQWYGEHSKSAYFRLATDDHFYPSQEFITLVETHDLPPIRRTISIPDKHDAAVYLTPDGHGDLTTATVPDDCTVAILPPGARIVELSEAKPKRKRKDTMTLRLDPSLLTALTIPEMRTLLYRESAWRSANLRRPAAADIAAQEKENTP